MAATRKVKVTTEDIEAVSKKLNEFAKKLPAGEQNVMAWLLARAAEAPPQTESFLNQDAAAPQAKKGVAESAGAPPGLTTPAKGVSASVSSAKLKPSQQLSRSLGVTQFSKFRPGSLAAGSSIGVTGTVMF